MTIMNINSFCREISPLLQLIGQALNIFKITLPLVLIILGIVDIGKAVISSKSDDVKKNLKNFFKKLAVSVLVFFVPTIVMVVFGFIRGFSNIIDNSGIDYSICYECMFNPSSEECTENVELSER